MKGKVISELEMPTPAIEEVKESEGETTKFLDGAPVPPTKPKEEPNKKPSTNGKKPLPTMVAGQALTFAISIVANRGSMMG